MGVEGHPRTGDAHVHARYGFSIRSIFQFNPLSLSIQPVEFTISTR